MAEIDYETAIQSLLSRAAEADTAADAAMLAQTAHNIANTATLMAQIKKDREDGPADNGSTGG